MAIVQVILFLGAVFLVFCLFMRYFHMRYVYYPIPQEEPYQDTPNNYNLKCDDIFIETKDKKKLHAWFVRVSPSEPILVYSHGNAGNIGGRISYAILFARAFHWNVLIYDYRGFGRSSKCDPTHQGLRKDIDAVVEYARQIISGEVEKKKAEALTALDVKKNKHTKINSEGERKSGYGSEIILYGHSIGGAVTLDYIKRHHGMASLVIVENTLFSLRRLVVDILPQMKNFVPFLLPDEWRSDEVVENMRENAVFIYGTKDEVIPNSHTKDLFNLCASQNKFLIEIPNSDHNGTLLDGVEKIVGKIGSFLKRVNGLESSTPKFSLPPSSIGDNGKKD